MRASSVRIAWVSSAVPSLRAFAVAGLLIAYPHSLKCKKTPDPPPLFWSPAFTVNVNRSKGALQVAVAARNRAPASMTSAPERLLLLSMLLPQLANGFTAATFRHSPLRQQTPSRMTAAVHLQQQPSNDADDRVVEDKNVVAQAKALGVALFEKIEVGFDVFTNVLGIMLALGLVLNICGFGYTFHGSKGLVVSPLSEMRAVNAEREFIRSAAEIKFNL